MVRLKEMCYGLIIIGAGPAGLTAALYAARFKLNVLVIGKIPGGLMSETPLICNFPSYKAIKGHELVNKMVEQVISLGVQIKQEDVVEIKNESREKTQFRIITENSIYNSRKIILTTGMKRKHLNIDKEDKFAGKGISYCVNCDGPFFKNKITGVVGGGSSALTTALLLAEYSKKVYVIYRKGEFFRAEPMLLEQVNMNGKIIKLFNSEIVKILGNSRVEGVKLSNGKKIKLDGIFVEIGYLIDDRLIKQLGLKTEENFIVVDKEQRTNIKGVFAAGDITNNPLKQITTACGEGSIAANSAYADLRNEKITVKDFQGIFKIKTLVK